MQILRFSPVLLLSVMCVRAAWGAPMNDHELVCRHPASEALLRFFGNEQEAVTTLSERDQRLKQWSLDLIGDDAARMDSPRPEIMDDE